MEMTTLIFGLLIFVACIFTVFGDQAGSLRDLTQNTHSTIYDEWVESFATHILENGQRFERIKDNGSKEAAQIILLPGQPSGVKFKQYSGYVSIDPRAQKSLFYYFVEATMHASTKPLILWLNGGPGCSSVANGGFEEIGPFRVKNDSRTLYLNPFSCNKVANILFLDSPAGVGFSLGNSSVFTQMGDSNTATDTLIFLIKWLERFPEYKNSVVYLAGESYAGHCVPQLANLILLNNNSTHTTHIHLQGIIVRVETGPLRVFDIYTSLCPYPEKAKLHAPNNVRKAWHTKPTDWALCSSYEWKDRPATTLPMLRDLIERGLRVWMYSGDVDAVVPVTSTRYSINKMRLGVEQTWRPWYSTDDQIGGYVVGYQGLVFVTIRGAGHEAPVYQPMRVLTMISSFLKGRLPPKFPPPI